MAPRGTVIRVHLVHASRVDQRVGKVHLLLPDFGKLPESSSDHPRTIGCWDALQTCLQHPHLRIERRLRGIKILRSSSFGEVSDQPVSEFNIRLRSWRYSLRAEVDPLIEEISLQAPIIFAISVCLVVV